MTACDIHRNTICNRWLALLTEVQIQNMLEAKHYHSSMLEQVNSATTTPVFQDKLDKPVPER